MNGEVQLIVGETYLDLYENESISQNWKFQDLSNFTAQGAFSREFRLPFSETNKEALGALFDNNVEQGAENYFFYKLPAEIRVDTLPIATGYLRVRKVYKQMSKLHEVEVAFYAETPAHRRGWSGSRCYSSRLEYRVNINHRRRSLVANLTDLEFKWIPGVATDVQATWRRFGWVPPSEQQQYLTKWKRYKGNQDEVDSISVGESTKGIRASTKVLQQPALQKSLR